MNCRSLRFLKSTALLLSLLVVPSAHAEGEASDRHASIAAETDILSFFIGGYSAMVNVSFPNKLQLAFGVGSYDVPSFLLEGDEHFDTAKWEAECTAVQVLRATYRFKGPMKSGPALGVVAIHQDWKLTSAPLAGETTFRPFGVGLTGGYYFHIGDHFYVYPTAAFTYNKVLSGSTSIDGTSYEVEQFGPNASLHIGWEWGL